MGTFHDGVAEACVEYFERQVTEFQIKPVVWDQTTNV